MDQEQELAVQIDTQQCELNEDALEDISGGLCMTSFYAYCMVKKWHEQHHK